MELLTEILKATALELNGRPIGIKEVWGGFLSRAFIVEINVWGNIERIFVRMRKYESQSTYDDIDQRDAFARAHLSWNYAKGHPRSLFVTSINSSEHGNVVIHWQEFREPKRDGINYHELSSSDELSIDDEIRLKQIANGISELHSLEVSPKDNTQEVYTRSILEILINPELTFTTLAHFPNEHPYLWITSRKYEFLNMMARAADRQIEAGKDRECKKIHGDFWNSNVLFDELWCYFVDFSRIPFGEPGIDVGWYLWNLAVDAYITWKRAPRRAFKSFAQEYIEKTWDEDILKNSYFPLFWIAIIRLFPPVYNDENWDKAEKILKLVSMCYDKGELFIPE